MKYKSLINLIYFRLHTQNQIYIFDNFYFFSLLAIETLHIMKSQ